MIKITDYKVVRKPKDTRTSILLKGIKATDRNGNKWNIPDEEIAWIENDTLFVMPAQGPGELPIQILEEALEKSK